MRIVSLLPAATDIVAALGAADRLVGRTHECDWPPEVVADVPVVTRTSLPTDLGSREISAAAHRGSAVYHLDSEALDALRPDLILTQDLCAACAVSYRQVSGAVRMIDLDTTVLSLEARTIDGILDSVATVGRLLGASDRADAVAADARRRLSALPGPRPDGPAVLFVEWLDPLMPGGHWVPEQIAYAGGRPLLLGPGEHSRPHEWSAVPAPDVVVYGPCGFAPEKTLGELAARPPDTVPAYVVDGPAYFNRPGPRVVDGAEILAAVLSGQPTDRATRV